MSKPLFSMNIAVRWRDLDAFGHVNNANFLGFIEEARVQWFKSICGDWVSVEASPILAAITVNYRKPIGWPESLLVEMFIEKIGTKSLTIGHRVLCATDPACLYADGNAVMVWVNGAGQSIVLPDMVRVACTV